MNKKINSIPLKKNQFNSRVMAFIYKQREETPVESLESRRQENKR